METCPARTSRHLPILLAINIIYGKRTLFSDHVLAQVEFLCLEIVFIWLAHQLSWKFIIDCHKHCDSMRCEIELSRDKSLHSTGDAMFP
jgi:hypothetical protein